MEARPKGMKLRSALFSLFAFLPALAVGCAANTEDDASGNAAGDEDEYTSASAKLLDFEFDGEVLHAGGVAEQTIKDQMLFTIGQLNGKTGVGRLDKLVLTNVRSEQQGALTRVTYHAKLPVSMSKNTRFGRTYNLQLPKRADWAGQEAFYAKYGNGGHGLHARRFVHRHGHRRILEGDGELRRWLGRPSPDRQP